MSAGICFHFDPDLKIRDYWSYIFENFKIKDLWEVGRPDKIESNWQKPRAIDAISALPKDKSMVVGSPKNGRYMPGTIPLPEFQHPENALYVFGSDRANLYPELFKGYEYQLVYIPGDSSITMYSFQAGIVFMYDRMVKNG